MKRSNVKRVSGRRESSAQTVGARKKNTAPEGRRLGKNHVGIDSALMSNETRTLTAGAGDSAQPAAPVCVKERTLRALPKELGVLLLTAGAVGVVLPGPGLPTMLAGADPLANRLPQSRNLVSPPVSPGARRWRDAH